LAGKGKSSSSKKIMIYAVIGIIAVAAVSVSLFARGGAPTTNPVDDSRNEAIKRFQTMSCGNGAQANSNGYVSEFVLPSECEMPVGIEVSSGKVWYVSSKQGLLGSYSLADNKFEKEYQIPSWPARSNPTAALMSWDVKADGRGNVWFTDQANNLWKFDAASESFDMYRFPRIYPSSFDFDSSGNIYISGFDTQSLWFGDITKMKNGTSEGITEIPLPLDAFSGVDPRGIGAGSVTVDNTKNEVWTSLVAYPFKGVIFRYDIETKSIDVFEMPPEITLPSSMILDNSGNLWVTDHATSTFFRLDPETGDTTRFATSIASAQIYGGTTPPNAYTLPYWIERGAGGAIWFNEHTGNKIAKFDPDNLTLVEYWIPSQNRLWAICPPEAEICGVANALQFSVGSDNQVWFSEWSENKIGSVDAEKQVPVSVSTDRQQAAVTRGNSIEIKVTVDATGDFDGAMLSSGTLSSTGNFVNSTGVFSEESVSLGTGESKEVSFTFSPSENLKPGEYTIMLGAGNSEVSFLKAVRVTVN
jgi:virginiamycin B lyase